MAVLNTSRIIKGIQEGLPIAPYSLDERLIDAYIDSIKKNSVTLHSNSVIKLKLFQQLAEPLVYLTEDKRADLGACDIFVLPLPLCLAYSDNYSGNHSIVIATGLIDLIASTIEASCLQAMLPEDLESYILLNFRRDMSAAKLVANTLFIFQYRFYRYGNPLPNILPLLPERTIRQCQDAVNGAILFVLMHELGHIKLGHLENNTVRPIRNQAVIDEELTLMQKQEYEADQFALESLIPEAKIIGTYWHANAMSFLQQLELVSGNKNSSHPLAINRSFHSDALRGNWGETHGVKSREEHYRELARRFEDTALHAPGGPNALLETSPSTCIDILVELDRVLRDNFSMSIERLWSRPADGWLNRKNSDNEVWLSEI